MKGLKTLYGHEKTLNPPPKIILKSSYYPEIRKQKSFNSISPSQSASIEDYGRSIASSNNLLLVESSSVISSYNDLQSFIESEYNKIKESNQEKSIATAEKSEISSASTLETIDYNIKSNDYSINNTSLSQELSKLTTYFDEPYTPQSLKINAAKKEIKQIQVQPKLKPESPKTAPYKEYPKSPQLDPFFDFSDQNKYIEFIKEKTLEEIQNKKDDGITILGYAAYLEKDGIVEFIIDKFLDKFPDLIKQKDDFDFNVLHWSILGENENIINYVLDKIKETKNIQLLADINCNGDNSVSIALKEGNTEFNIKTAKKILENARGDDTIIKKILYNQDFDGNTLLHILSSIDYDSSDIKTGFAKYIIKLEEEIKKREEKKEVEKIKEEEVLSITTPLPLIPNKQNVTPLHITSSKYFESEENKTIFEVLCKNITKENIKDSNFLRNENGNTPVHDLIGGYFKKNISDITSLTTDDTTKESLNDSIQTIMTPKYIYKYELDISLNEIELTFSTPLSILSNVENGNKQTPIDLFSTLLTSKEFESLSSINSEDIENMSPGMLEYYKKLLPNKSSESTQVSSTVILDLPTNTIPFTKTKEDIPSSKIITLTCTLKIPQEYNDTNNIHPKNSIHYTIQIQDNFIEINSNNIDDFTKEANVYGSIKFNRIIYEDIDDKFMNELIFLLKELRKKNEVKLDDYFFKIFIEIDDDKQNNPLKCKLLYLILYPNSPSSSSTNTINNITSSNNSNIDSLFSALKELLSTPPSS